MEKPEITNLKRWRDVGDGPISYTAGSKQFADDVIVALAEISRLTAERDGLRKALEPLAVLEVPQRAWGNAGAYSIRHSDIERAKQLLATPTVTDAER
jgi:hypothetical protein